MDEHTDVAKAERLSERRARMLPVLLIIFVSQQVIHFSRSTDGAVNRIHIAAWLVMSVVMILFLLTGGGWLHSERVRDLANDESTRAHRDDALRLGFLMSMAAGVALYVVTMFEPVSGRDAIHGMMTIGIAAALIRMAILERRAHR
jgi:hypothetical protein